MLVPRDLNISARTEKSSSRHAIAVRAGAVGAGSFHFSTRQPRTIHIDLAMAFRVHIYPYDYIYTHYM
jgi:hypothetical protein